MIRMFYKIGQLLYPTPTEDDSSVGDLPTSPHETVFSRSSVRLHPKQIINNMLSHSKNIPVVERHGDTGDVTL